LASQKVGSDTLKISSEIFSAKEKRKNFKELKWPLWLLPTRLLKLSKAAIKKAID